MKLYLLSTKYKVLIQYMQILHRNYFLDLVLLLKIPNENFIVFRFGVLPKFTKDLVCGRIWDANTVVLALRKSRNPRKEILILFILKNPREFRKWEKKIEMWYLHQFPLSLLKLSAQEKYSLYHFCMFVGKENRKSTQKWVIF